jgi:hypothetical protein
MHKSIACANLGLIFNIFIPQLSTGDRLGREEERGTFSSFLIVALNLPQISTWGRLVSSFYDKILVPVSASFLTA